MMISLDHFALYVSAHMLAFPACPRSWRNLEENKSRSRRSNPNSTTVRPVPPPSLRTARSLSSHPWLDLNASPACMQGKIHDDLWREEESNPLNNGGLWTTANSGSFFPFWWVPRKSGCVPCGSPRALMIMLVNI